MARCPRCNAHNAADAAWCSQCFHAFAGSPTAGPTTATVDTEPSATGASDTPEAQRPAGGHDRGVPQEVPGDPGRGVQSGGGQAGDGPTRGVVERGVRERGGEVEWHCATCDTWNDLFDDRCAVCGTRRVGFGAVGEEAEASPVAARSTSVIVTSLLMPGLGHMVLGRSGAGLARIAVFVLWIIGGVSWTWSASGPSRPPGLVLLAGATLLWVATQFDVVGLVGPRRSEPLGNRGLLWLVVGVTVVLAASVAMLTVDVVGQE